MKHEKPKSAYALLLAAFVGTAACSTPGSIENTAPISASPACTSESGGILTDMKRNGEIPIDRFYPNHVSFINTAECARVIDQKTGSAIGSIATGEQFYILCTIIDSDFPAVRVETDDAVGTVEISPELDDRIGSRGENKIEVPVVVCPPKIMKQPTPPPETTEQAIPRSALDL